MYFAEHRPAHEVALCFGYTYRAFTSLVASFREKLESDPTGSFFFIEHRPGRKVSSETDQITSIIEEGLFGFEDMPDIFKVPIRSGRFETQNMSHNAVYLHIGEGC